MLGEIKEIKTIHEALKDISYDTWLILDLDNTVMESRLELGGDAWFSALLTHATQHVTDKEQATALVIAIYRTIQFYVRTKAVESDIVAVIKGLQDIGIPVIGLTARDYFLSKATVRQLADIDIDFSRTHLAPVYGSMYERGIIYCDGRHKGEAFKQFLDHCQSWPSHIVMLDDKKGHLHHVHEVVEPLGIRFTGARYGFLDEKVKQFDMEKSKIQLAHLKARLPKYAQEVIEQLQLHPQDDDFDERLSPSAAYGFFLSDSPRGSVSSDDESYDSERAKTLS